GDFFSPHLFCLEGVTATGRTFARHFGTPPDTLEDPFTGSATGGMAAYLWHYGLIDTPSFWAEQGHWMQRPGVGYAEVVGPPDAIETVQVGGAAVTVLRGELML
ncbi:MAG: PhzF family phenazine biosynthesis protein, partial [Anaerolineae bacterium]|nr:PhzF family phenazine biosynthesis protein [Anaerolineae bacterium]